MKIRSQIGMVLNLDKCIGCHTCSITCKNVWTSREGMEYAWFNNVESKPGIGYPKEWENQDKWKGGWVRNANGSINPRIGGKFRVLANIFANPDLPSLDDYYEPFDFDYQHLHTRAFGRAPTDRASALAGVRQAHAENRVGPELGRNPRHRVRQAPQGQELRPDPGRHLWRVRKHLHDVPAAPVRALPQPGVRGLVPERCDLQA
jgi:nitrate reductase beta subunit